MKKPMKKYVNGVLNLNYLANDNRGKSSVRFSSHEDLSQMIEKRTEDKKIYDSRLNKVKEKTQKELREETYQKVEKAKELLGIKETSNKKNDTLDNYKAEYRKKHEIRDFKERSSLKTNDVKINYDDIFKDL